MPAIKNYWISLKAKNNTRKAGPTEPEVSQTALTYTLPKVLTTEYLKYSAKVLNTYHI